MITKLLHAIGYALLRYPPCPKYLRSAALRELRGRVCRCGKGKAPGFSFCGDCYNSLLDSDKQIIGRVLRRGYVFAYFRIAKQIKRKSA